MVLSNGIEEEGIIIYELNEKKRMELQLIGMVRCRFHVK